MTAVGAPQMPAARGVAAARTLDRLGIALLAAILIIAPLLTSSQYHLNVLVLMAANATMATGLAIVVRAGRLSLAQASFAGIGGYTSGILVMKVGLTYWLALPAAGVVAGLIGILLGLTSLRLRGFYFAIATFTFSQLAIVILRAWPSVTGGMSGMFGLPFPPPVLGISFSDPRHYYYLTLVALLLAVIVYYACSLGTRFGRGLTVLGEDEVLARSLGVPATRYRLYAFAISSFVGGIAGSLSVHFIQGISPSDIQPIVSVFVVVMVVAGGARTLVGPVIGAIILTAVPEFLRASAQWAMVFHGVFLLAYVFFFREGLLPILKSAVHRVAGVGLGNEIDRPAPAAPQVMSSPIARRRVREAGRPLLQLQGVDCAFGSLRVLKNISWEIEPGRINGLIGPNGAGKTTFFNVISGIAPMAAGTLLWHGEPVVPTPEGMARRRVARTFQHARVLQNHTVEDSLLLGAELAGGTVDASRVEWLVHALNLFEVRHAPGHTLTHYQRRLVSIGMAMASDPEILLLDEPLAGLDDTETEQLTTIISDVQAAAGNTVLLIEHKLGVVMKLCAHLTVLDHGQIIANGDPQTVASNEAVIEAYLGNE